MSGAQQIQALTWTLYVVVFALVLVRTIRRPTPAHINMSLFFGAVSLLIALTVVFNLFVPVRPWWFAPIIGGVLMALPYLLAAPGRRLRGRPARAVSRGRSRDCWCRSWRWP